MPQLHAKEFETTEQSIEFMSKQIENLEREMRPLWLKRNFMGSLKKSNPSKDWAPK